MAALKGNGYTMEVWQHGAKVENFVDAYNSGERFSVTWIYSPTEEEQAQGARNRQYQSEDFAPRTAFIKVIGEMKALRAVSLEFKLWINTPELASLLGA